MTGNPILLAVVAAVMFAVLGGVTLLAHIYNLNNIKSKTVGDGQHGTARWASKAEIRRIYRHIPFTPERWREQAKNHQTPTTPEGKELPQGIVVGCTGSTTAMVDTGDVHALMIGGRRRQDCFLAVPLHRVCLRKRDVLPCDRHERRCHAQLWSDRQRLWIQRIGD